MEGEEMATLDRNLCLKKAIQQEMWVLKPSDDGCDDHHLMMTTHTHTHNRKQKSSSSFFQCTST